MKLTFYKLILLLLVFGNFSYAQDLIVLKNKDTVYCKIIKKNKYSIVYEEVKTIPKINKHEFKKKLHQHFDKQKALQFLIKNPYLKDIIITSLNDTISCNILCSTKNYVSFRTNEKDKPRIFTRDLIKYDEFNFYANLFKKTPDLVVLKNNDSIFTKIASLNKPILTSNKRLDTLNSPIDSTKNHIISSQENIINYLTKPQIPLTKYYINKSNILSSTNNYLEFLIFYQNIQQPQSIAIMSLTSIDICYFWKKNLGAGLKYFTITSNQANNLAKFLTPFIILKKDYSRNSFYGSLGVSFSRFKPVFNYSDYTYTNNSLTWQQNTLSGKVNFFSTQLELGYEYSITKKFALGIFTNYNFFKFSNLSIVKTAPTYDDNYTISPNSNNKYINYLGLNLKFKNLFLK